MPPTIDFLPVATAAGANVEPQSAFAGSTHQETGFVAGIALSAQLNKCWRQSSTMSAALANVIALCTGQDVLDDGNVTLKVSQIAAAIGLVSWCGTSAVVGTTYVLLTPIGINSYQAGQKFRFIAGSNSGSGYTANVDGLGNVAIYKQTSAGLVPIGVNDIVAGQIYDITYDGTYFQMSSSTRVSNIFMRATVGSPISTNIGANSILSISMTMPATGGPYRVLGSYALFILTGGTNSVMSCYITDGTNSFAGVQFDYPSSKALGGSSSEISPVSYAAGSTQTFTLIAYDNANGNSITTSLNSGLPTAMSISLASNIVG